jgi:L-ribulokinase
MKRRLVIGMDFGTDSVRAILADTSNGEEIASAACNYPRWAKGQYTDASKDQFRHHPLDYLESMTKAMTDVMASCDDPSEVEAIAIDSTASTPCLVDEHLVPLSLHKGFEDNPDAMFIIWKDHTSAEEAKLITERCAEHNPNYACHMGNNFSPECFWSKVLHVLRGNDKLRANAFTAVELCDWIPIVLTGCSRLEDMKPSHCVAGAKHLWAEEWGGFPPESFFEGVDPLLVPILRNMPKANYSCAASAGNLCKEWASKFGLSESVKVGVGNIDSYSGAVGGGVAYKTMVMNMGTSACYMAVVPTEIMAGRIVDGVFGQVDDGLLEGTTGFEVGLSAFGDLLAWMRRLMSWPIDNLMPYLTADQKAKAEDRILVKLTEEASKLPIREDAPVATDYFNGRRVPRPDGTLTGTIVGLKIASSPAEIFNALVEAIAFATKVILDFMDDNKVNIERLIAIGGVAQKSPFVMQKIADVTGRKIEVSESKHTGALGAAIHAAVIAGIYPTVEKAQAAMCQPIMSVFAPNEAHHKTLMSRYQKYLDIVDFTEKEKNK